MRILVAEGNEDLQALTLAALGREGHELIQARDGLAALALFREREPDLVLTAFSLPGLDGLELSRLIRLTSRKRIVPVIMFAEAGHPGRLRQCLEAGVVEFINRPVDADELRCRVEVMARFLKLQLQLLDQQARTGEELDLVKHVLARLTGAGNLGAHPGFHMETLQTERINGDACLYREGLPGVHFGLICDATGHGLMAGVSTIPVVETFLSMVSRDLPLGTIYREIHGKLTHLLPTGRFACLLLLRLDGIQGVLSVLNAGMPDALLLRASGALQSFPSRVLPAGIAGVEVEVSVQSVDALPGDRLLAYSDGFGDLLGEGEAAAYLKSLAHLSHGEQCRVIQERVLRTGSGEQRDDVSWALWEVPSPDTSRGTEVAAQAQPPPALTAGFQAAYTLDPRCHPVRELLPHLIGLLQDFRVNQSRVQLFAMLVTEALTNAVDHGLLRLDSSLKGQGFEAYDQHRTLALETLEAGSVRLTVTLLQPEGPGQQPIRKITTEVADTGAGFDWRPWLQPAGDPGLRPFGRGIALLQALGTSLRFNAAGNALSFDLDCP